ncbi:MAG: LTA synthase family protein [Oscillospiraceae bacterium]|nr:LTA synthase family protein [Oscillospiraceae bacterium]
MTKLTHAFTKLKTNIAENPRRWFSRFIFALGPFFAYCAVEVLNNNDPFTDLELWRAAWNIGWYIAIFVFFWLVTGCRRGAGAVCAASASFLFGLVNHYVLRFRGSALFPIDLIGWRTAVNVAEAYDYSPDGQVWLALGITAFYIILAIAAGMKRRDERPRPWLYAPAGAALCIFLAAFFLTNMLPSLGIYAEQWQTRRNGFVFNFMTALRYSFLGEPEGYELEEIEEFKLEYMEELEDEEEEAPLSDTEPVNVILIMNESWADLSVYENYSASMDTMENINSLDENTVSGYMYSPVIGGGTANVEYEVLTGNPYLFLPTGTVAYQLYIDSESPSLATLSEEESGSETWAFHPYLASGWNRVQAYDYLGFDGQLYDEDLKDPEYVRQYISDEADFEVLTELTEETEGNCFIFNVTMQNHSGYDQSWKNLAKTVRLTGELKDAGSDAEQYLALADETDRAFARLVDYYAESDEPTLIAMFGDHQPPLGTDFYELLLGEEETELSDEELLVKYKVPFVVWANYDIPEAEDVEVSTNYFGLMVSDLAGFERTPYMDFVADVAEELPVIHRLGFITDEGEFADDRGELDEESLELLELYEALSYNYLADREEDDEFFEGTD